jgi:hypothetical protein
MAPEVPRGWREVNAPGTTCTQHQGRIPIGHPCYLTGQLDVVLCAICAGAAEAPLVGVTLRPLIGGIEKAAARCAATAAIVASHGEPDDDDDEEEEGCPMDEELAKAMNEVEGVLDSTDDPELRRERIDAYAIAMIRAGHALGAGSVGIEEMVRNAVRCVEMVDMAVK